MFFEMAISPEININNSLNHSYFFAFYNNYIPKGVRCIATIE